MQEIDVQIPIERFEEVPSTNQMAREAVESGEIGDHARMFVAGRQTSGRGRFNRAWASPPGGLWCTLVWPVNLSPKRVVEGLGLRVGLACVDAVEHILAAHGHDADVRLKWPNDVLINGKKVLGVLCEVIEHAGKTYVLAGVGVNVDFPVTELPEEMQADATTLRDVVHGPVRVERLLQDLRVKLRDALMQEGLGPGTLAQLRQRLYGVGRHASVVLPSGKRLEGELKGVTDDGRLRIDTSDGEEVAPPGAELAPEPS